MKRITTNPAVCTGCRACEMACSFSHTDMFSSDLSRIHIAKREDKGIDHPIVCQTCEHPPCVEVCPVDALAKDQKDGHIIVDEDACIGCGLCAGECPYLAISYHLETAVPLICDLCDGDPACVKRCVTKAIRFENPANQLARQRGDLASKLSDKGEGSQ